ncbi:MAG: aminotransferase class III-fold pyridoxal phosphate-dependent enzyme [Solirubrobacterales bacterium]|nr:aminotransferase class III-fold pyridoxal phosphate-dependent enzyme [Solirubrobacterales bacterium]
MDEVLTANRPRMDAIDAVRAGVDLFGVGAHAARDLGSERDRTFALDDTDGVPVAILKVSNPSEDPAVLDMEAAAALHVAAVDPELVVALPHRPISAAETGPDGPGEDPSTLRAPWPDAVGRICQARLYDPLPGASRIEPESLSDAALGAWGDTAARLGQAMRGFFHPEAHRVMLWDVQHALRSRELLGQIVDRDTRALVGRTLDAFAERAAPAWPRLRAQVLHADLTVDNTITDREGLITGIIDFGDMSHTALVTDLASVLDSVVPPDESTEMLRRARLVLDGYQRRVPLEEIELEALGVAWAARSAITIAISSWRVAEGLEEADFAERYNESRRRILERLESVGWDELARSLGASGTVKDEPVVLATRRAAVFGPAIEPLFYEEPVEVASAAGVWITATDGRRYLDAYNNVPCVGHGHPRVTEAIARQSRTLNTHTRYLHPAAIELAERLAATCPPELDTVLLVNSGSEANDWAWRLAAAATGNRGALCSDHAYHGVTEATAALSPEVWFDSVCPGHVETFPVADSYRKEHLDATGITAAIGRLAEQNLTPAATILDGLVLSDGIEDLDPAYVQNLVRATRGAGGLWIADEVQAGHGRTGEAMWCFERFDVVPDFVTLGKPMGNGHPVAAVITRRDLAEPIAERTSLFSTFGGNPVSAAAALAVLDVIEDERVLARTRQAGDALGEGLTGIATSHPAIGDVRGVGLAWGVELVRDRDTREPDPATAVRLRDEMRRSGILTGTTGRHGNVLKIRPPLAFTVEHAPIVTSALERALAD